MQLGNAAWGLRETPLEQQLAITAAMGLELLELSIAGYDRDYLQLDADEKKIAEVAELFRRYNVRLDCACTGNDFTGDDAAEQLTKVKTVIDIASKLGVKFLRIFAGFRSDSEVAGPRFGRMIDCLRSAAEYAAPRGVTLAVETHGGVMNNGDALVHFASATTRIDWWDDILSTGVSINYDPANFAAVGATDPVAFYNRFKKAIQYVHLKDFRSVEGGVLPAACGEGRLDWPALMAALADYTGPALIEYELPGDVEDGLRRSLAYLKQFR
ncbi:sugar phosphate isomerase/epimerase [uncultured Victivallis sp.]|uniref:sugar phosphate isomerase/epimerase family protein n=1 Tax=uncultured Victivallis sp. TaxID=354118 RepID=UPI0025D29BB1|nr:sugar phosphate isomerase/epimerase family protein [uncultured Victivallis sp.]